MNDIVPGTQIMWGMGHFALVFSMTDKYFLFLEKVSTFFQTVAKTEP